MAEKQSWKDLVEVDLSKVKARDVAKLASSGGDAKVAYAAMADMLTKIVVKAPIDGDLTDPETYFDLPQFDMGDDKVVTWAGLTTFVNEIMAGSLKV